MEERHASENRPAKRSRTRASDAEASCPVCFEAFDGASRTRVSAFDCGSRHSVCTACARALYVRRHDNCPLCRAPRSVDSLATLCHLQRRREPPDVLDDFRAFARFSAVAVSNEGRRLFFPTVTPSPFTMAELVAPPSASSDNAAAAIEALRDVPGVSITVFRRRAHVPDSSDA